MTTPELRAEIYARDGYVCQYCGRTAADAYHIDHVMPVSWDGPTAEYNLVVACADCNRSKNCCCWIPNNLEAITVDQEAHRLHVIELGQTPNKKLNIWLRLGPLEPREPVNVRFDPELLARIDTAAKRRGISRQNWIQYRIAELLEQEENR